MPTYPMITHFPISREDFMGSNDSAPLGILPMNSSSVWEGHVIPNFKMSVMFRRGADGKLIPADVYSPGRFRLRMIAHEERAGDMSLNRDFSLILQSVDDARLYVYLEHLAVVGEEYPPHTKMGRLHAVCKSVFLEDQYHLDGPLRIKVYSDKILQDGPEEIFVFEPGERIGKVAVTDITPDGGGSVQQWNFGVIDKRYPRKEWQTILDEKRCYPNWITIYNAIKNLSGPNLISMSGLGNNYIDTVAFTELYKDTPLDNWPTIYQDLMNSIFYDHEIDNNQAVCQALAIKTGLDIPNRLQGNWFARSQMENPNYSPTDNEDSTFAVNQSPYHQYKVVIGIGSKYMTIRSSNTPNRNRVEFIIKPGSTVETKTIEGKTFVLNKHPKDIKAGDYFMYEGVGTHGEDINGVREYIDNFRVVGYMSSNYEVRIGVGMIVLLPSLLREHMWEEGSGVLNINETIVKDMDEGNYTFQRPVIMELPEKDRFDRRIVLSRGKIIAFAMLVLGAAAALAYYFFRG